MQSDLRKKMRAVRERSLAKQNSAWNRFALSILLFLILFHAVNNLVVFKMDRIYLTFDPGQIYLLENAFLVEFPEWDMLEKIWNIYTYTMESYPPLFSRASAVVMSLFGRSPEVAAMTNMFFFPFLLVGVYLLGCHLFNRETGLISAVLLSFFPGLFSLSRLYKGEFALVTVTIWCVLVLVKSQWINSRKDALQLGVLVGLAALTKPSFSVYLLGPFFVITGKPVLKGIRTRHFRFQIQIVLNVLLAGLVALLLAFPWYVVWGGQYLRTQRLFLRHMDTPFALRVDWGLTISNLFSNHLWKTLSAYLFEPVAWVFGAALLYLLLKYRRHRALLLSWILVPYILLNILGLYDENHIMRYMGSVLPAVALIMGNFLQGLVQGDSELFPRMFKGIGPKAAIVMLLLVEMPLFAAITYRGNGNLMDPFGDGLSDRGLVQGSNQFGITSPSTLGWDMEEVGDLLEKEWAGRPTPPRVFFLNELGFISEGIMIETRVRRLTGGVDFIETRCWEHMFGYLEHDESYPGCESVFNSSDYVILEEIRRDEFWVRREVYDTEIAQFVFYIKDHLDDFTLLRTLSLTSRPEELPAPDSPAFSWLNGSAWILKRNE